jgi:hypothetical protein
MGRTESYGARPPGSGIRATPLKLRKLEQHKEKDRRLQVRPLYCTVAIPATNPLGKTWYEIE